MEKLPKLRIDFEIPQWLDNEVELMLKMINENGLLHSMISDDLLLSLEDAVMTKQITHEQGALLTDYYVGKGRLRV